MIAAFLLPLLLVPVAAGDPPVFRPDPVLLLRDGEEVAGMVQHSADHGGYRYLFRTPATREAFLADPERLGVQLGGACARMGALSGRGSPDIWTVHDERLYFFASEGCREGFLKAPERMIDRPDPVPETTPETLERGAELVSLALQGLGGAERVDSARTLVLGTTETVTYEGDEVRAGELFGIELGENGAARARWTTRWGDSEWSKVLVPGDAWFEDGDEPRTMHASQRLEVEKRLFRIPVVALRTRHRDGFLAVAGGPSLRDGDGVELLTVACGGATTTFGVRTETGEIVSASFVGRGPESTLGEVVQSFRKTRDVGGLTLAVSAEVRWEGREMDGLRRDVVEVDTALRDGFFERGGGRR